MLTSESRIVCNLPMYTHHIVAVPHAHHCSCWLQAIGNILLSSALLHWERCYLQFFFKAHTYCLKCQ